MNDKSYLIPNEVIEDIKNQADIVKIISDYINVTRKGQNFWAVCPFHGDTRPSLSISTKKKIWKCFSCGAGGDVFSFVSQKEKINYIQAVRKVAEKIGYDLTKFESKINNFDSTKEKLIKANEVALKMWYEPNLFNNKIGFKALKYLNDRQINEDLIKKYHFGFASDENIIFETLTIENEDKLKWEVDELVDAGLVILNEKNGYHDFFRNRIMIPIFNENNRVIGFSGRSINNEEPKYLNTGSTKIFNKSSVLFNINNVRFNNAKKIIITEGFMDVLAYEQSGINFSLGAMGTTLTNGHVQLIRKCFNNLQEIILSYDNDNAGTIANIKNGKFLIGCGFDVSVVGEYDKNIKDIDDLYKNYGSNKVVSIIENKRNFVDFLIDNSSSSFDELSDNEKLKIIEETIQNIISYSKEIFHLNKLEIVAKKFNVSIEYIKDIYANLKENIGFIKQKDFEDEQQYNEERTNTYEIRNKTIIEANLEKNNENLVIAEKSMFDGFVDILVYLINYDFLYDKYSNEINLSGLNKKYIDFLRKIDVFIRTKFLKQNKITIDDIKEEISNKNNPKDLINFYKTVVDSNEKNQLVFEVRNSKTNHIEKAKEIFSDLIWKLGDSRIDILICDLYEKISQKNVTEQEINDCFIDISEYKKLKQERRNIKIKNIKKRKTRV